MTRTVTKGEMNGQENMKVKEKGKTEKTKMKIGLKREQENKRMMKRMKIRERTV